ncbi:TPA: hypothetical protein ACHTAY_002488 [Escherichia coli]
MKNITVKFYDNKFLGNDGKIEFVGKTFEEKLGKKQIVAITDKYGNAANNAHMFKAVVAKLRKTAKCNMTEKQIEKLFVGAKKFFKNSALVITHIEVMEIGDKKCVAVVASRVERDSLDTITKYKDHRVFWFGCRFQMDKLTREPKITCSTNAGVNPYVSVLTETMTQNANGTSYRGGVFKRMETGKTLEGSRELTEARKETNRKSYEAMKARKAAAKAEKEEARKAKEQADAEKKAKEDAFAPIRDNAKTIDSQLDSFEMPEEDNKPTVELPKLTIRDVYAVNLPKVVIDDLVSKAESFNKKEEEMPMEEKKTHQIMIDGKLVTMVVKEEEEYKPSFNIADLRAAFLASHKPMNWDDYEVANDNEEDYEEMSDEDREAMERDADLLHMEMYGCGYGCGVRSFRK